MGVEADGLGLAGAIRDRQVSAEEAVTAAIERIEQRNGAVNAVVHARFDEALDEVRRGLPDGPFTGVPFLLKDLAADIAGMPSSEGSRLLVDRTAEYDSALVARYRAAGLVILGTTNTPEFGKNASTEPLLYGPTRNPWDTSRSAGGSSGGSAAAVASGMVPVAHGNDGGGSIRIPAAMCGLFGLKPTRGRVPVAPYPISLGYPFACHHALTTTVRDSAALLDVVSGGLPGDPYAAPPQPLPFVAEMGRDPGRLRIAISTTTAGGLESEPARRAATERLAARCEELGHTVEAAGLSYDEGAVLQASAEIMATNLVVTVDQRLEELGRELADDDIEPFSRVLLEMGRAISGPTVLRALQTVERTGREVGRFFETYDLLLTPTAPVPTPVLGTLDTTDVEAMATRAAAFMAFTSIFNLTGQPAMSVPAGYDGDGLPVGVQFAGRFGAEATLLQLAAQIEEAEPWVSVAPGYETGQE